MKNFSIGMMILAMGSLCLAQSVSGLAPGGGPNGTTVLTTGAGGTTPTPTNLPTAVNPNTSVQTQGQNGVQVNGTQQILGEIGMMASVAAIAKGVSTCPYSCQWPWIIGGAVGMVASIMAISDASKSGSASANTVAAVTTPTGTPTPTPVSGVMSNPKVVQALAAAKANGVSIDTATGMVTLPNGTSFNGAAAAKGDMSGTGLSAADQAAAKSALASIMKDATEKAAVAGTEGNGSGDNSGAGATSIATAGADGMGFGGGKIPGGMRGPSGTAGAGMKKVVANGTDAVGVSTDNIFTMIANRYNATGNSPKGFVAQ